MTRQQAIIAGLLLILVSVGMAIWAYPALPDRVPIHWDASGQIDGYASKIHGLILMPAIITGSWLLMIILPPISPKGFKIEQFASSFYVVCIIIIVFFNLAELQLLQHMRLGNLASRHTQLLMIGALIAIIGALMGRFRKNFFIGVRTPWTLASDEVWERTHRVAGRLWTIGGLVIIVLSFRGNSGKMALGVLLILAIIPIAYSYLIYRRIDGLGSNSS